MHFDGRDLIVYADENEVFRWSAQSGRPVPGDPKHAADCGADPVTESYMDHRASSASRTLARFPRASTTSAQPGSSASASVRRENCAGKVTNTASRPGYTMFPAGIGATASLRCTRCVWKKDRAATRPGAKTFSSTAASLRAHRAAFLTLETTTFPSWRPGCKAIRGRSR